MTYFSRSLGIVAGIAIAIQFSAANGQSLSGDSLTPPSVPPEIQVPAGHTAYLKGQATGTQNYICLPAGSGFGWKFLAPQATLFLSFKWMNMDIRQQITTHFLSANPAEGGMPRPTWQGSADTSVVWAKAAASSDNSAFVAPGAIPWLLLEIVGSQKGPTGGTALTLTKFIHRVNTSGGVMPSSGCATSTDMGKTALVPYTADYFFYRPSGN
jgi:hypothetical protein